MMERRRNLTLYIPGRIKASLERQPKLISTNQNSSTPQALQKLQDFEIIIGLNRVADDGIQALQRFFVGLDIPLNLRLAVQVEWPFLGDFHDLFDLNPFAVQESIARFPKTVLQFVGFGLRRRQDCPGRAGSDRR